MLLDTTRSPKTLVVSKDVALDPVCIARSMWDEADTTNDPVIIAEPVNGKVVAAGRFVNPLPSPTNPELLIIPDAVTL